MYTKSLSFLMTVILLPFFSAAVHAQIKASYLYSLSDFNGSIPFGLVKLTGDEERGEVYVINKGIVSIFNGSGMEVYQFGDERPLGAIVDVTVDQEGNILMLSYKGDDYSVIRCNFRGEPKATLKLSGLPDGFSRFLPRRLIHWNSYLYFADFFGRKIVVTDRTGSFVDGYDVGAILAVDEKPGSMNDIVGFSVDKDGNMLFTVPTIFRAFRMSRDGTLQSFGSPGNIEGKFNIVSGIASDDRGFIYVVDTLKSTVMVYDKEFNFQTQFGYRGDGPENLIAPRDLEVINGKIFVNQARRRGISVFRMAYD